ncbi:MAG: NmrA/HSCARG family protein, partial [Polyangiales bacterium]
TMPEAAAGLSTTLGKKIEYESIPMDAVRQYSEDVALMLEWFERVGYDADIAGLPKKYGIRARTFQEWLRDRGA